ncbi:hypothetical protein PR202_gb01595 [Eleusine coracana subsp. coracana]|uniref:Uncharacterized protein n=1 Tax=Eleusine coracana subsp. coracana TaxID=191504 RepID=A0AAV5DVJ0_ELECO|nr:hypothetical protein PR202_gb01595 [Eleusine coracana subsp. coracana]
MLRKRSCAALMAKARSRHELIYRRCSFRTLLTTDSFLGLFLATTRRPLPGRGLAEIRLGSISAFPLGLPRRRRSPIRIQTEDGAHVKPPRRGTKRPLQSWLPCEA